MTIKNLTLQMQVFTKSEIRNTQTLFHIFNSVVCGREFDCYIRHYFFFDELNMEGKNLIY